MKVIGRTAACMLQEKIPKKISKKIPKEIPKEVTLLPAHAQGHPAPVLRSVEMEQTLGSTTC